MDNIQFGILLTKLRNKEHLSQKSLSEKLFVSASTVCKWEQGKNRPDLEMINLLAELFHISVEDLLNPENTLINLEQNSISVPIVKHKRFPYRAVITLICLISIAGIVFGVICIHVQPWISG